MRPGPGLAIPNQRSLLSDFEISFESAFGPNEVKQQDTVC